MRDHPLREQARERLRHVDQADMLQGARPEAGIEKMQDRMLDAADILADRQPLLDDLGIELAILGLAGEADEIP